MNRLLCVLALLAAAPAAAQEWEFGAAPAYETGRYGGPVRVDSVYVPLTVKRYFRNTDLALTIPWQRQSATGRVVRLNGRPVAFTASGGSAGGSAAGLGDLLLAGTYQVKRDGPGSFDFSLAGRLKLPTASEEKGLGTGELDQGAGFVFSKLLNPRWTLLASGYYTIIGDPEGLDFNNALELSVGFYKPLDKGFGLTVLYETLSALADGAADPRTLSLKLGKGGYACSLAAGLSEGSPDLSLGVSFARRY